MRPPAELQTSRLLLRPPTTADAEAIFERYAQDPEVVKYLLWRPHKSLQDTLDYLARCEQLWRDGSSFPFAILQRTGERLIGMVEIRLDGFIAGLGYVL